MLDNKTTLRLGDSSIFTDKPALNMVHGILTIDYEYWPCGAPVVFDKSLPLGSMIRAFSLFPPRANVNVSAQDLTLPREHFEITKLKPICQTHRNMEIETFDYDKVPHLSEYVKHMGGITFIMKGQEQKIKLAKQLSRIVKPFKYSSLFYYDRFGTKWLNGEDDDYLAVMSFYDLPYCVPIFNTKRVDGMGISYCQVVRKASVEKHNLLRSFRLDFVVSNYEENLFVIDGCTVNPMNPISDAHYREVEKSAAEELIVRSPEEVEAMQKKSLRKYGEYKGSKKDKAEWQVPQGGTIEIDQGDASHTVYYDGSTWSTTSNSSND